MAIKIALAGNPNCGKTTMFNALTGANQYVGNWPGVTVEKKEGKIKGRKGQEEIIVTDLPGIYSLSPYTLEEVVSRDYLLKENPHYFLSHTHHNSFYQPARSEHLQILPTSGLHPAENNTAPHPGAAPTPTDKRLSDLCNQYCRTDQKPSQ